MLFDDIACLGSAALEIRAAIETTRKIKEKQSDPETAGTIGMLQQFLQQAAADLQAATPGKPLMRQRSFPMPG
jgi:hypothetical protein